ncbi:ER membrane glycoprotein subunit of the GPI transamidase complex-like protein [Coemansia sp. RSA 2131]|nr:ER membrane glycoprotein subunit of the GPI transamidase complex-like protein [Coemansia sp. RSA 2131]
MFEFLYEKTALGYLLTHDFSQYIRPLFSRLDDWQYKNYRAAGCFGKRWNKDAKEIHGVLRLEFVKGKDIPHDYPDTSSSRFVLVRVGNKHDYCLPVPCNNGEPRFGMISYFDNTMFDNMLVEITVVWGGAVKDSMVGRVCIPVKELYDVREYHGWLELEDSAGNPAGSVASGMELCSYANLTETANYIAKEMLTAYHNNVMQNFSNMWWCTINTLLNCKQRQTELVAQLKVKDKSAPEIKHECKAQIWGPAQCLKELLGTGRPVATTNEEWAIIQLLWLVLCSYSIGYKFAERSIYYDTKAFPLQHLKASVRLNAVLAQKDIKCTQVLPLRHLWVYSHVPLNTCILVRCILGKSYDRTLGGKKTIKADINKHWGHVVDLQQDMFRSHKRHEFKGVIMTDGVSISAVRETVNEEPVEISTDLKRKHEEPEQQLQQPQYGQPAAQRARLAYQPVHPVQPQLPLSYGWQPPQLPSVPSQQQQLLAQQPPQQTQPVQPRRQQKADCEYISNLLQEQLQSTAGRCVLVDPGRRDLLYMLHEESSVASKNVYRYTRCQQRKETRVTKYKKILEREKKADIVDIAGLERTLSAGSYLKPDLKLFEEYLAARADVAERLTRFYNKTMCRQLLVNRLRKRFTPDAVFVMGNWSASMTRYHEPIQGKFWRTLLKHGGFTVYLINEHLTSSFCPNCEERISTFLDVPNPRPWMRTKRPEVKCHGLLGCTSQTCVELKGNYLGQKKDESEDEKRDRCWTVVKYALLSRAASLILGIVSSAIVNDYDASAQLVLAPATTYLAQALRSLAHVVLRWDALYFVHIAGNGYVYEQEHAFFPLLPILMRTLTQTVLRPLVAVGGEQAVLTVAGCIISSACFVAAAVTLYTLGQHTLRNERLAYIASLLFVFAPSNMFMSAVYTESLFAWLVFSAMLCVARQQHVAASLWLCASTLCRSNGVMYAGYLVWNVVVRREAWIGKRWTQVAVKVAAAAGLVAVSALGFVGFQIYGYRTHCLQPLYPEHPSRAYCDGFPATVYGFVQAEYWDVGFLRYYTLSQIPNFLLAAPMIVLSIAGLYTYAAHDPVRLATLGWKRRPSLDTTSLATAFLGDRLLPHIYLWALLLAVATTTMHVQVITRMFSAVPAVFWFAAHLASKDWFTQCIVTGYFVGYGLVGVVLFSNFFPPA